MFGKKKGLYVRDSDSSLTGRRNLPRTRTFGQSEFSRFDIPGELEKAIRRLVYAALSLVAFWFIYECWNAWNVFQ